MRILTRYIFKEMFAHCLLGLLVFTFVLYVRPLSQVLEIIARRNLPISQDIFIFTLLSTTAGSRVWYWAKNFFMFRLFRLFAKSFGCPAAAKPSFTKSLRFEPRGRSLSLTV